jgi:hypothetical protein
VSRTLDAVECVGIAGHRAHFERHGVIVSTDIALSHSLSVRVAGHTGNSAIHPSRVDVAGPHR